jgi:hypothetical protein
VGKAKMKTESGMRLSDDDVAAKIICKLQPRGINKEHAVELIKSQIEELRTAIRMVRKRPRPNDMKREIKRITDQAKELAKAIDNLDEDWKSYFRLAVFTCRSASGAVLASVVDDDDAKHRMAIWISGLRKIPDQFSRCPPKLMPTKPKTLCAFAARGLINALAPATKLKKGENSTYHEVASSMWEAATGERDADLRWDCDRVVDLIHDIEHASRASSD